MANPEAANRNPDAYFEYENFSPQIQAAIDELHKKLLESFPIDASATAEFFRVPEIALKSKHVEYFKAYASIAVRQLIIGAFYGPNQNIKGHDIPQQAEMIRSKDSPFVFSGSHLAHDIAHTVIALGRNTDTGSRAALVPDFQRRSQSGEGYGSENERLKAVASMQRDENMVDFWTRSSSRTGKSTILDRIRDAKEKHTAEDGTVDMAKAEESLVFRMCDGATPDEFTRKMFGRIFNDYEENEMLTFDLFLELTLPFMKREAPEVARTFR